MGHDYRVEAEGQAQEAEDPLEQREERNAGHDLGGDKREVEGSGEQGGLTFATSP